MAKPRGLRTGPPPDRPPPRHDAPLPAARVPPFLLVLDGPDLVLIAPFRKRRRGPTPEEAAAVRIVAEHLRSSLPAPGSSVWISPQDGTATPASIGVGQLRRRLLDCASFEVRL